MLESGEFFFKLEFPWETVARAYFSRFPVCAHLPSLLHSEVLSHEDDGKGRFEIERRATVDLDAPRWLTAIIGHPHFVFVEKCSLDKQERSLKLVRFNDTISSMVRMEDRCEYSVHPRNPNWTQKYTVAMMHFKIKFLGVERAIERAAVSMHESRVHEGNSVDEALSTRISSLDATDPKARFRPWPVPQPAIEDAVTEKFAIDHRAGTGGATKQEGLFGSLRPRSASVRAA